MDKNQLIAKKNFIFAAVNKHLNTIKALRLKLHENAELGFEEYKTHGIILEFLRALDLNTRVFAKTGIAATLNSDSECIAIRADMDALPVNGVSHVCGHDYHMAIALGTAMVLKELKFEKCVKFIFQPAEENIGGALPMIQEGVLENPLVKNVIGFHVWPKVNVGTIEVSIGPSMGSVDDFKLSFKGIGGHAAMPHLCKNPMYPAIDLIETINNKSRIEVNPLNSHVITFSSIQCGTAPNIIADECRVLGTVRTFDNALRHKIKDDIIKFSNICAEKYGCTLEIDYNMQYPPVINEAAYTEAFITATKELIGDSNVLPLEKTFAAEDFSFFAENVPSVHFRLGIAKGDKGTHPLHSPYFNASDECLARGIAILVNFILSQ